MYNASKYPMKQPNIVIIGHVCIDHNSIDGVRYDKWGSPAAYISKYYTAQFDIQPSIISPYGADFLPFADGLNLACPPMDGQTMLYENISTKGHRIWFCRYAGHENFPTLSAQNIALLSQADIVFVAPLLPSLAVSYVQEALSHVPTSTVKVLVPQGYLRSIDDNQQIVPRTFMEGPALLQHMDVAIFSDEDQVDAFNVANEWTQHAPQLQVVVTEAERGATVVTHGSTTHISTTPVPFSDIKNPVGSGDIFSAELALGLFRTNDVNRAVNQANAATAAMLRSAPLV